MAKYTDYRNHIDYGLLESYTSFIDQAGYVPEYIKGYVEEIKLDNPASWAVAKEDFEIYRFW